MGPASTTVARGVRDWRNLLPEGDGNVVGTDRRAFLKKAGVAGAAAGGLWVAPSVLGSSSAFAVGSCVMRDTIDWSYYSNGDLDLTSGGSVGLTPYRTQARAPLHTTSR